MKRINVFIGNNAQGKSNFIEAIYLLGSLRSFRGSKKEDIIMNGKDYSKMSSHVESRGLLKDLELTLSKAERSIRVNNNAVSHLEEYYREYKVVTFTPDDTMLIKGYPEERRTFLNRGIVTYNPEYYRIYRNFSKALDSKRALLKNERSQKNDILLWNKELAKYAASIYRERAAFIRALNDRICEIYSKISHTKESCYLTYKPSTSCDIENTKNLENDLIEELNLKLDEEIRAEQCLIAPTRDDVGFTLKELPGKHYASQGEIKTIVLALKIAHIEYVYEKTSEYPIFLLDDVSSELDHDRRSFLMKYLHDKPIQIFLTTTKFDTYLEELDRSDYIIYSVDSGVISPYAT